MTRDQLQHNLPHYSDEELWRAVIVCRLGAKLNLEVTNLGLGVGSDGSKALMEKMESMDAAKEISGRCESQRDWRALARQHEGTFYWFWIGSHEEYQRLIKA